ncbi:MAG: hypothetical protein ACTHJV_12310 [Rhizobiaceae bacterium]
MVFPKYWLALSSRECPNLPPVILPEYGVEKNPMTDDKPAAPDQNGIPEKIGTALGFILVVFVAAELLYAIVHAVMST